MKRIALACICLFFVALFGACMATDMEAQESSSIQVETSSEDSNILESNMGSENDSTQNNDSDNDWADMPL